MLDLLLSIYFGLGELDFQAQVVTQLLLHRLVLFTLSRCDIAQVSFHEFNLEQLVVHLSEVFVVVLLHDLHDLLLGLCLLLLPLLLLLIRHRIRRQSRGQRRKLCPRIGPARVIQLVRGLGHLCDGSHTVVLRVLLVLPLTSRCVVVVVGDERTCNHFDV